MIRSLAVHGYRSISDLVVGLDQLTVVTGANGTGKSSLYRALSLLADAASNGIVAALAREGGLASTLWAGPPPAQGGKPEPVSLRLGFGSDDFGYALDLGLPPTDPNAPASLFPLDPELNREALWHGPLLRPASLLVDRANTIVKVREGRGWTILPQRVAVHDCLLSELSDPQHAPEVFTVRQQVRSWRFYDQVRTDADSPARRPAIATRTFALAPDGHDLPAALATILETGSGAQPLLDAVEEAFGGTVGVREGGGRFELLLDQRGLRRSMTAAELSDGTLRYLVWAAALLSPRPPQLLVLNEPETSLHPSLLPALGGLIAAACERAQLLVVTHSEALVDAIEQRLRGSGVRMSEVRLVKNSGRTAVDGAGMLDAPPWAWPKR